jgi:predicted GNAT family acetyltransferase
MVADRVDPADAAFGEPLTAADAQDMLALAELTRPGPFAARTVELGHFFGIRHDGRLVAMVGERMRVAGWTEVSGVSTHPDVRGRHLAERLVRRIVGGIVARGERPFLHVLATNRPALGLYRRLGFTRRRDFVFQLFEPTPN